MKQKEIVEGATYEGRTQHAGHTRLPGEPFQVRKVTSIFLMQYAVKKIKFVRWVPVGYTPRTFSRAMTLAAFAAWAERTQGQPVPVAVSTEEST